MYVSALIFLIVAAIGKINGFTFPLIGMIKASSIMQFSLFVSAALFINVISPYFDRLSEKHKDILIILVFAVMMGTMFEMLFSFNYWFSYFHFANLNQLDYLNYVPQAVNPLMDSEFKVNLNVITKMQTCLFFISAYLFYCLNRKRDRLLLGSTNIEVR